MAQDQVKTQGENAIQADRIVAEGITAKQMVFQLQGARIGPWKLIGDDHGIYAEHQETGQRIAIASANSGTIDWSQCVQVSDEGFTPPHAAGSTT